MNCEISGNDMYDQYVSANLVFLFSVQYPYKKDKKNY